MHHTHRMSRTAFPILWLSLSLGGLAPPVARAGDNPASAPHPGWELLAQQTPPAPKEKVPGPTPTGRSAAPTREFIVAQGSTQPLQMTNQQIITRVDNPKPSVAVLVPDPVNPRIVQVTGKEPGITRVTLHGADGSAEVVQIVVQLDVEFLRVLLLRATPTATLTLLPTSSGTVVISGHVERADDIDIIMRTATSVLGSPERVVNAMRIGGVQQIQLDVVIAFVSRSEMRRMSFDFLDQGGHHTLASTLGGAITVPTTGTGIMSTGSMLTIPNTVGAPNGAPANLFLALFNDEQLFFGFLQALRNENLSKILAHPTLVVQSGQMATLLSGGQQAVPEAAGLGTVSVRFEPFGTRLRVLPIVLGNGRIRLEVEPEVSSLDQGVGTVIAGTSVAGRITQNVHTTVEIEDGQTLGIGGLIQNTVTGTTVKLPILGDLPFIGTAFSSKSYDEAETELVVLVTPHVVDALSCDQLPKYLPGQETRTPDDFELFLEGILEAPRGPRAVFPGRHYKPAFQNSPTAALYPCAGNYGSNCGTGCATGACATDSMPMTAPISPKAASLQPVPAMVPEAPKPGLSSTLPAPGTVPVADAGDKSGPLSSPASALIESTSKEVKPFAIPAVSERNGKGEGK